MTSALIGLCVLVFALLAWVDQRLPIGFSGGPNSLRLSTLYRFGVLSPIVVGLEPWRLLSAVFLHFSLAHLAMNMWGLWGLGTNLERRFGGARAAVLFFTTGIGGFYVSTLYYGLESRVPTAGASGAVFGQLGGLIGILVARRMPGWRELLVRNVFMALLMGFALRVNNAAHFGGLAIGWALGFLFEKEPVHKLTTRILSVVAALCAIASVASLVLSSASPIWQSVREEEAQIGR
ncbi:MAG TPA: rhomboid family intramembrane serine protease [Polyangiaceae bacterium]|nr:rhomboid family intramembrane serine protease [Polyangiaceae bacterium]